MFSGCIYWVLGSSGAGKRTRPKWFRPYSLLYMPEQVLDYYGADERRKSHQSQAQLSTGDLLTIHLVAIPSTGYQWTITEQPPGLVLQSDDWVSDNGDPEVCGSGGREVRVFAAQEEIHGCLRLEYSRVWETIDPLYSCQVNF